MKYSIFLDVTKEDLDANLKLLIVDAVFYSFLKYEKNQMR